MAGAVSVSLSPEEWRRIRKCRIERAQGAISNTTITPKLATVVRVQCPRANLWLKNRSIYTRGSLNSAYCSSAFLRQASSIGATEGVGLLCFLSRSFSCLAQCFLIFSWRLSRFEHSSSCCLRSASTFLRESSIYGATAGADSLCFLSKNFSFLAQRFLIFSWRVLCFGHSTSCII